MMNDKLNMPDHWQGSYQGNVNMILCKMLYKDSQERRKGTWSWDFMRHLFEMEDTKEYMKLFKELFECAFEKEEDCQQWIDSRIIPLIKTTDWGISCYINSNTWTYSCIRPSKFRDYANHRNIFIPTLIMEDTDGTKAAFATSCAFDSYDSYEDLVTIENFTGIFKNKKAVSGVALYNALVEKWKKSDVAPDVQETKDSEGKKIKYRFNISLFDSINAQRFAELKKIKNSNVFRLPNEYSSGWTGLQFAQPTVIATIKGSNYKKLFMKLGTEKRIDGGVYTIVPDNSPFPKQQLVRHAVNYEQKDTLLSPETILNGIKDDQIYWLKLTGWTRYSVPLIPDGHYKKRWQSQFDFVNPDEKFDTPEWTLEKMSDITVKDKWGFHLAHGDKNLEYYSDKKGKSLDWWLKVYARIDKVSYDLTWSISAEHWNTTKLKNL